jgi:predicted amidohydrolase
MTQNGNLKRRVRARAAKTGESYTAALRNVRQLPSEQASLGSVRLAVAQTSIFNDPRDIAKLRASGEEIRRLMRDAHRVGARLIHFPEGTVCAPNKRIMSELGPGEVGVSDWSQFEWASARKELVEISGLARELKLWTVVGSVHELSLPHRPHNSLYIISDKGELVNRYDERMLSNTKISFMYSPGKGPVTFDVDGVRFGCALGMETHYAEIFAEYEKLGVDCVLFSTTGETPSLATPFAAEVLGHAAANGYWVSYAAHAPQSKAIPSGIAAPEGHWAVQCMLGGTPEVAIADIAPDPEHPARPWRRTARSDLYTSHQVTDDPRSDTRTAF